MRRFDEEEIAGGQARASSMAKLDPKTGGVCVWSALTGDEESLGVGLDVSNLLLR